MKTVALLGNPNVGKTTLFNALTGSNQYVGNWPGVTVDKKEGKYKNVNIVDLPGIYAMDAFSNEEIVAKNFLKQDDVDLILNIVDGNNLDRNLYLTTQLKQFNKPIILVINMIDEVEAKGIKIDYEVLSKEMNITIVPISASKNIGLDKLKATLLQDDFDKPDDGDLFKFENEGSAYRYIEGALSLAVTNTKELKTSFTEKLDKVLLNPFLAYPIFLLIMFLMFEITFSWVGQPLSDLLSDGIQEHLIPWLNEILANSSSWFQSLIVDGIVSGVGNIIVLLPIILSLFLCIIILEDSGYMSRVAFLMDKIMRKIGLSGKAFIPMIVGFGCTVPAIMTSKTLESEKDRKLTALLVPLMSCNARLPVYTIFATVFFKGHEGLAVACLYAFGIIIAFIIGIIFKHTLFKKDEEPFILELPKFKAPSTRSILRQLWDKAKDFLIKAGTLIFAMSVVLWFLSNFNFSGLVSDVNSSLLAQFGSFISPIFAPLGFASWQTAVALLSGLMAKESIISSMSVIYGGTLSVALAGNFTTLSAVSFLVFILLYTPCISVIGTMKKEYGGKFAAFSICYQMILAWIVSCAVYNIGSLII